MQVPGPGLGPNGTAQRRDLDVSSQDRLDSAKALAVDARRTVEELRGAEGSRSELR